MRPLLLVLLLAPSALAAETAGSDSMSRLLKSVSSFLNGPVRHSHKAPAVAAVRGGIPTEQGEDLDQRLLDRARLLRESLLRPDASSRDAHALSSVYEALAASQYTQALAVSGEAAEAKSDAAMALSAWAAQPHDPPLPEDLKTLMSGAPDRIDDKALVAAGWGGYVHQLSADDALIPAAKPGWSVGADAARLDESLKSVRDSLVERALAPDVEAQAHVMAGRLLRALAGADLRGREDAGASTAAAAASPAVEEGPAPAAIDAPFDPKTIYRKAVKSVALILCASSEGSGEVGTGSVVDAARRLILTNAHVVIRDSTREPWPVVRLYFKPERMSGDPKEDMRDPIEGKVIAYDRALDLALVQAARLPDGAAALELDDPRAVDVGDRVAAIGHPEQGGLWTLTTGVVSARVNDIGGVPGKNAFQTDASINRGNSGGPLLDARGRIVGVNTSMARKAADGLAITAINFALRSDVARRWMAAQNETIAYGGPAAAAEAPAAAPPPAPARRAPPAAPAARPAPKPAPVQITESRPYDRDAMIAAEVAKMEQLEDEMHQEIQQKLKR